MKNLFIKEELNIRDNARVENFKLNHNYIISIDDQDKVYFTTDEKDYKLISNNEAIFNLLSNTYCQLALDTLFTKETLKEFDRVKREYNIRIEPSINPEYIEFVRKHIDNKQNNNEKEDR